jgi:excisionase family DNA binding protein
MQQLNMFGPPEQVDTTGIKGRCDWEPVPWERENLWPSKLVAAIGADTCETLWGDIPRHTRLSVEQVCRRLLCDGNTIYRLIEQGELDTVDIGAGRTNPAWRVYRYSLVWFLFRREWLENDTRPNSDKTAGLTEEQILKLYALAKAERKIKRR